ncbi:glycosyltransferase family 9 protein [Aggregatilineales bacterium SYSU G02658]
MNERILLVLPCCIGDVVLATAALRALRRAHPTAHLTWAVGRWSAGVLHGHPDLDALLDTGDAALPVRRPSDCLRFRAQVAAGRYDAAVSFVRSPLMAAALWAARVPVRVGLNSGGRGRLYTVRRDLDPRAPEHEADIYLSVLRAWGIDTGGCVPTITPSDADEAVMRQQLAAQGVAARFIVVNPAGGANPGMTLTAKRYPLDWLAQVVNRLSAAADAQPVLIGGPSDAALVAELAARLAVPSAALVGALSLLQLGALARASWLYLGNDTGLTHLASACGARAVMFMGPTDPRRYGLYGGDSLTLWRPAPVSAQGVAGAQRAWDWARDGMPPDEAYERIAAFVGL